MPELPEVEILVRHLDPQLRGKTIRGVSVLRDKVVRPQSVAELSKALVGQQFERVERRAKYLVFRFRRGSSARFVTLVGHLGMTGRMFLASKRSVLPKHAAVTLDLGRQIFVFEDTRYFGRFNLDTDALESLGPEPLSEDFTVDAFTAALRRSVQPVKVKLLDQTLVAGVGNIYASEALFRAGISPRRASHRLSRAQITRLRDTIREVLLEAIQGGSTLPLDLGHGQDGLFYFGSSAEGGRTFYEERLLVYDRAGQPCRKCRTPIRQIVQSARSTYYCPQCQRR